MVVLVDAHAVGHSLGAVLGEDGGTRIALLLGVVPICLIALEVQVELTRLHLRFL